jgi:transposase
MALSQDLRLRIVDLVASGVSRREAARRFRVSASSAIRFVRQAGDVGHVDPKVPKKRKSKLDPYRADIIGWIGEQPDLTLAELCARLDGEHGLRAGSSTLDDWLRSNQITYKKTDHASEQERSDVKAARQRWRKRQDWLKHRLHLLDRIVFIDETGLNTKMARLRGRSIKGQRLVASIPHGHWKTMTFIAGLRHDGMTAPWVLDGPIDGPAFVTYIKTQFAPTLRKGDVVVMDNLPAHKVAAAKAAIKERGAWLLFLPPYSPDLNPIELAFSKLKAHMKRLAPRTVDAVWKSAGKILELFSKQECANFFTASGYGPN